MSTCIVPVLIALLIAIASAHKGHGHHHQHVPNVLKPYMKVGDVQQLPVKPFNVSDYTLTPGSRFANQQARNSLNLVSFNLTDLTCQYTSSANLTGTYTNPTCRFTDQNGYFGHYLGHYLSATALMYSNTGDATVKAAGATVVNTMQQVQDAWTAAGEPGYVFSYNTIPWDNLLGKAQNCAPVCVPFYIYHKMLAGLLDQYTLVGNQQAYSVMMGMVDWAVGRIASTLAQGGQEQWQAVLGTEWGGMNEVLFNIAALTGNETVYATAMLFNHWAWTGPFIDGRDGLPNNHANTHIPEIIGDARGWELSGNATKSTIVTTFFSYLNDSHTFATGGSNDHEYWGQGNMLGDQMDADTEESCTMYNTLKVARRMIGWNGGAEQKWADFYERGLFNGLIGNQATSGSFGNTDSTGFIYMLPIGQAGQTKPWGDSQEYLPCCWGTLSEVFSKLGDSVFFASADDSVLFLNLFVPLSLSWKARGGAVIRQTSNFPYEVGHTTTVSVDNAGSGGPWTLSLRVPIWATAGTSNVVSVNGSPVPGPIIPGQYLNITRTWAAGDSVTAWYPPSLRWEPLNDARDAWNGVGALLYGGILLAGVNSTNAGMPINVTQPLEAQIFPDPTAPVGTLRFLAPVYGNICDANGTAALVNVTLTPLMDITFEQYTVYWHTQDAGPVVIGYNGTAQFSLPGAKESDFIATGGASITPNGGDVNIRSGDPDQVNVVFLSSVMQDPSHSLTGFNFTFRYVSGYGPAGAPGGTTFSLVLLPGCDLDPAHLPTPLAVLYNSPVLDQYSFDACNTCYSPPIVAHAAQGTLSIPVSAEGGARLAMIFHDNSRNVQLDLPLGITFWWTS